jgi:hypothetical protein
MVDGKERQRSQAVHNKVGQKDKPLVNSEEFPRRIPAHNLSLKMVTSVATWPFVPVQVTVLKLPCTQVGVPEINIGDHQGDAEHACFAGVLTKRQRQSSAKFAAGALAPSST